MENPVFYWVELCCRWISFNLALERRLHSPIGMRTKNLFFFLNSLDIWTFYWKPTIWISASRERVEHASYSVHTRIATAFKVDFKVYMRRATNEWAHRRKLPVFHVDKVSPAEGERRNRALPHAIASAEEAFAISFMARRARGEKPMWKTFSRMTVACKRY